MLYDFRIHLLRLFTLFSHLLFTTVLFYTKVDSIKVTLNPFVNNDADYHRADVSYTGLIAVAVILLLVELGYAAGESRITWATMVHVFLDIIACLFTSWIILDGLPWDLYVPVWVFCVYVHMHAFSHCRSLRPPWFIFPSHPSFFFAFPSPFCNRMLPCFYDIAHSIMVAAKGLRVMVRGPRESRSWWPF